MHTNHPIKELVNNEVTARDGAHILYMYNNLEKYVENATTFIYEGLTKGSIVLYIDDELLVNRIKENLKKLGIQEDQLDDLICLVSNEFYLNGEEFDAFGARNKLTKLLQPLIDQGHSIHTWGDVPLPHSQSTSERVLTYECECDLFVSAERLISVCTYNSTTTPAYIQNELLKTHTHLMTDDTCIMSPLYSQKTLTPFSAEELEHLQQVEKQYEELKNINSRLEFEFNVVKLKNDAIKQSEEKLRTIINKLPIPIIIRSDTTVLFLNDKANEHFLAGKNEDELNELLQKCDANVKRVLEGDVSDHHYIIEGENQVYLVNSINLVFEDVPANLQAFVDITQEKENEKLMIRSEKMTIAGELAASIAHELRNPLTAVKGFFQMLRYSNDNLDLYYSVINDELSRIEQIASELLTLAKPHADYRKNYNIVQLVEEVKLLLTSQTNMKNIGLLLEVSNRQLYINCDNNKIKQVLINIIKNAIDAMENGGDISIKIHDVIENVQIQITDQGRGIPKDLMGRIGEPFYTTKEKGTGIGLMVCFQIIESHNGTIHVQSEIDVGTTFTITLPKAHESLSAIS